MYAIIRKGNGDFYTSMVFGYYRTSDDSDFKNRYWIVLNKEKTALIKQHVFQQDSKYIIPMVLITDADDSDWNILSQSEQSVSFLPTKELLSGIDSNSIPKKLIQKCIDLDKAYHFEEIRTVATPEDIRDLNWVSGGFHDSYISEIKEEKDQIYILFDGAWGCKIEVWFNGDPAYDASGRDPRKHDPNWFGSTVIIQDGFVYLIDEEETAVENINPNNCWFKGRNMKYHIIPE